MIPSAKVIEVRQLLAQGNLSQRQIARASGVSRGTVGAIASGKRPDYAAKPPEEERINYDLPPQRCQGCGAMVYVPCRTCRVRALREGSRRIIQNRRRDGLKSRPSAA